MSIILNLHPAHKIGGEAGCVDDTLFPLDDACPPPILSECSSPAFGYMLPPYPLLLFGETVDRQLSPVMLDAFKGSKLSLVEIFSPLGLFDCGSDDGNDQPNDPCEFGGGEEHPGGNDGNFEVTAEDGLKLDVFSGGVPPFK